jgi:hypothetical protein
MMVVKRNHGERLFLSPSNNRHGGENVSKAYELKSSFEKSCLQPFVSTCGATILSHSQDAQEDALVQPFQMSISPLAVTVAASKVLL